MKKLTYSQRIVKDSKGMDLTSIDNVASLLEQMKDKNDLPMTEDKPTHGQDLSYPLPTPDQSHTKDRGRSEAGQPEARPIPDKGQTNTGPRQDLNKATDTHSPDQRQTKDRPKTDQSYLNKKTSARLTPGVGQKPDKLNGELSNTRPHPIPTVNLTQIQYKIYLYLFENRVEGVWLKKHILKHSGCSAKTLQRTIDKLENAGILTDDYDNVNHEHSYIFNADIPIKTSKNVLTMTEARPNHDIGSSNPSNSKSVSINKNLLTTQIETDPDLEYWKQKDLPIKKIESWMQEFELDINQILNQLRYSAFDWQHKTEKEVQKPIGKFYTALKTGGFAKPSGYKTPEEKRRDIINAEIEEKEKLLQEIKAKNKRLKDLAFELWLEELSSQNRKNIIGKSNLTKKQKDKGRGPAIDAVLKSYYQENIKE